MTHTNKTVLIGQYVQLETIADAHHDELYVAAQDERIWTFTGTKAFGDQFENWFKKARQGLENGTQLPFVVRRLSDQKVLGSTRYYHIDSEHRRLTIGYTWYIPEAWGTLVNPESKYLLLKNVFENMQINRVEFMADVRNERSRAAIKKLGATEEGILRQHMIVENGYVRDSVIFSIIKPDWPQVKSSLEKRLQSK